MLDGGVALKEVQESVLLCPNCQVAMRTETREGLEVEQLVVRAANEPAQSNGAKQRIQLCVPWRSIAASECAGQRPHAGGPMYCAGFPGGTCGIFTSVSDLAARIRKYIRHYNKDAKPIRWSYRNPAHRISSTSAYTGH